MNKKILIIVAHPDDEVLGCFATVAKMIKNGYEAYTLILGKGQAARGKVDENAADILQHEMFEANSFIGVKRVFSCDFPDNMFDSVPMLKIVKEIENVKMEIKPDIIFTHHFGDINIDHQITYKAVLTATRPMRGESVKTIYSMFVPSSSEWNAYSRETAFVPNVFVDVTDTIDLKIQALEKYRSELREYPHPRSLKYIEDLSRLNGAMAGIENSENFVLVREIIL
jgi:LmbE family N-acetylglucosaminyl deacetylase